MNDAVRAHVRNPLPLYFGKIPSRADFVKSDGGIKVIALLDDWIARGMELLLEEPGWKKSFDGAGMIDFLFVGSRSRYAICGQMLASRDSSARRFPFLAATLFESEDAPGFLPFSGLALYEHAIHQRTLVRQAAKTTDATSATSALAALTTADLPGWPADLTYQERYADHLATTILEDMATGLSPPSEKASMRNMVLALGYLLQSIRTHGGRTPVKGLSLPLPHEPENMALAKCFWLDLVTTFLPGTGFELGIFVCTHFSAPRMFVTFNASAPRNFMILFDARAAQECLIDISQAAWVDDHPMQDPAITRLASYLEHGELGLHELTRTFRQCFGKQ